jgi:hypothetical protein
MTKLSSFRNMTGLVIVLIAALMLSACGGDDAAAAEPEPTAAPKAEIPEVAVVPAEEPEPGSDEEKILAQLEKQVSSNEHTRSRVIPRNLRTRHPHP